MFTQQSILVEFNQLVFDPNRVVSEFEDRNSIEVHSKVIETSSASLRRPEIRSFGSFQPRKGCFSFKSSSKLDQ